MLRRIVLVTLVALSVTAAESQAGPLKRLFGRERASCGPGGCNQFQYQASSFQHVASVQQTPAGTVRTVQESKSSTSVSVSDGSDALDEVNAKRAERGLRPFLRDPLLTIGAQAASRVRAMTGNAGHTPNDFAHLPAGAFARAAGCAAWHPGMGWGACCTYENWTYAGAAYSYGADGRRYMHLFVK